MLPFSDSADPQLPFNDPTQQRYELIRPVVVIGNRTATERARETGLHPETVGRLKRRFEQQGMLGLIPDTLEVVPARRRRRVPDEVVEELQRLKSQPFQYVYGGCRAQTLCGCDEKQPTRVGGKNEGHLSMYWLLVQQFRC